MTEGSAAAKSLMQCPHCHTHVPRGARVCTGCQAEVEYGASPALCYLILAASIGIGYGFSQAINNIVLGAAVGVTVLVIGCVFIYRRYSERVSFKRVYRTR